MTEPKKEKCEACYGSGYINFRTDDGHISMRTCRRCDGYGYINVEPLTNEEYIRSCSTEELAKLIYKIAVTDVLLDRFFTAEIVNAEIVDVDSGIKEAEMWLKEKHHE